MKIAVVGLGAVGGLIAARLAGSGHTVSGIARGATLAAVREHGLRVLAGDETLTARIAVEADAARLGPQDLVIVALKGPALADAATSLRPLLGPDTIVMPAMNGVPWWFLDGAPAEAPLGDRRLASVDPDGRIAAALPIGRVLGCVVHLTCSSPEPGVVRHGFGQRLIVGEPRGGPSGQVTPR
ncbi:MAG TPA: 2-dehydropantoate 2-reductase N-terminal domain-containing protein, partial [Burkholderiaceae bacterium]|nr:2-dehydropantoate 2-reductase N-terminal domain-containing protein [Burkholderiaceae bacterium]